jgi:hypothetical protein
LLFQLRIQGIHDKLFNPDTADVVSVITISVKVTLPFATVIQCHFTPMSREVNYFTVWVGHIPSVFPSIFADNVMVHSRNLEGHLHIILNNTLQELLNHIQVTDKFLLYMLGLLVVLARCVFRLQMERPKELDWKSLGRSGPIGHKNLRTWRSTISLSNNHFILNDFV